MGRFLGAAADAESDGLPSDDQDGTDDEDGVWFTAPLAAGAPGSVSIIASADGIVNAWLDFNDDGDWVDSGEQILTDVSVTTGVNALSFSVPSTAVGTGETFARFRISTVAGLGPGGAAADGEVEDYAVLISDQLGTIEGARWLDLDGDGTRDSGEPGFAGVEVFLDGNDNGVYDAGERITTTGSDGSYRFTDVAPGVQIVREVPVDDVPQTYPGPDPGTYIGTAYVLGTNTVEVTSIDAVTGEVTRSGVVLDEKLEGMVVTNDGRMFGFNGWYDSFYEIDPQTLQVELVGPSGAPLHYGLAYDRATDAIYGMANVGNSGRKFFVVYDRETGIPVPLNDGSSIVRGSTGMAWDDANERMVVFYNGEDEFFAFDPTGTATRLAPSSLDMDGRSLAYNGTSFVIQLVNIDDHKTLAFFDPDTGLENAPRLTMSESAPMESLEYVPGTPYGHRVYMEPGETVTDLDFGNDGELDFGDAPDLPYGTLLSSDGARHVAVGPTLGALRDTETDGQPTTSADGDDTTGTVDDEDGVTFGTIQVGQLDATVTVNVQNAPSGAKLDAWIDFNGDGSWGGPFEQIADTVAVAHGENVVSFDVPSWAVAGETYARFRLSTEGDLGSDGFATDGEVEDYLATIVSPNVASGMFAEQVSLCESGAASVHAADLDRDGDMDVLSTSIDSDTITWFENDGAEQFTAHIITTSADGAVSVFAADVDADGDLDVLSASIYDNTVAWYENDVLGFTRHVITTSADGVQEVRAADIDGDGDLDVLSASREDDTIAWYENDGDGNFTAYSISSSADAAASVFAADIDSDGDMDVLSASGHDDTIAWYENDGEQAFSVHTITTSADGALDVFGVDADGDGDVDVFSASWRDRTIAWYENDGSQAFTVHEIDTSIYTPESLFVSDMDGDGDLDVLVASAGDDTIAWYENDGSQSFTRHEIATSVEGARSVFAADVDGDGDVDALSASSIDGKIAWHENQNETPDFSVTESSDSTVVSESGTTDSFAVVLDARPASNVVIAVTSGDTEEAIVDKSFLTFTPTNWDVPQIVTVTGADDPLPDGDQTTAITLSIDDHLSDDAYDPVADQIVLVTTANDDLVDFGDAPAPYPTMAVSAGAWHSPTGPSMGANCDAEADGTPSAVADGDDTTGSPDDEDGVTFGSTIMVGQLGASLTVNVQNAPSGAKLDAWIDFNADGCWCGPFEQIAHSVTVTAGDNAINFDVPSWAVDGTTYARFRLSTAGELGPTGEAADGEVEDYQVTIVPPVSTSGLFKERGPIASGYGNPSAICTADVDGDGDQDLVTGSDSQDTVTWHENHGSGEFTHHEVAVSVQGPVSLFVIDVDSDGDQDLLSASRDDDTIAWYENDGSENFAEHTISTSANHASSVFAVDVDGDGDIDVLSSSGLGIVWHENDGSENFTTRTFAGDTPSGGSVSAVDVDGDGDIDILSASDVVDRVAWYENDGEESLTFHLIDSDAARANKVIAADVDGDGDMDVLSSSGDDDTIAWYKNNGVGEFRKYTITTSADWANWVEAADVDGDGDMDVLSTSYEDGTVAWYENDGHEDFTAHTITAHAGSVCAVVVADVDNDGDMDALSIAFGQRTIAWHENDGSENFTERPIVGVEGTQSVSAADLDCDGDLDVVAASYNGSTVAWYENDANGNFIPHTISISEYRASSVRVADMDGDGDKDVLAGFADGVAWYKNDGTGVFSEPVIFLTYSATPMFPADMDSDGDLDLLAVRSSSIRWYENFGQGAFIEGISHQVDSSAYGISSLFAADVDGDGDVDVLSASSSDDTVSWYENHGDGTFSGHDITTSSDAPYSVFSADLDGDGDLDVLSASRNDDTIAWYENDGAENFAAHNISTSADGALSVFSRGYGR